MVSSTVAGLIVLALAIAAIILICLIVYCIAKPTGRPLRPSYPEYLQGDPENFYMYNRNPANREQFQPTNHVVNGRIVPIVNEFYAPPAEAYNPNNRNQRQEQDGMVEYYAPAAAIPMGHMHGGRHPPMPMTSSQRQVAELQRAVVARPIDGGTQGGVEVGGNSNRGVASAPASSTMSLQQGNIASEGTTEATGSSAVDGKKKKTWFFGRK